MSGKCRKALVLSLRVPCILFESSEEESDEDELAPSKIVLEILKGLKLAAGSWGTGSSCRVLLCCASACSPPTSCVRASCVHCRLPLSSASVVAASRRSFPMHPRGPLCELSAAKSCMHSSPSDDAPDTDKRRGLVGVVGGVKMARLECVSGASRCLGEWLMSLVE